ncbi:MAG: MarR family winged helix-turn-helix transcriptional regulator [Microbacterium sp.]|jgi:DNA-binding MarR family transcriptional regulator|uniref:MarR family winged helix-turn-helix transcriptional regulator n=1 Tax=unclassified Microbacterium TaxID=2609290 RepID=UPI0025D818E1|nr:MULTISPECIES: MarR family winged helix-turn-helix transcriptional regulator [unclassified Microbacterium]|tara:strand:- start:253 stop:837 length:585 start_codon:yes stop_codon:yes gene_type:complete
MPITPSDPIDQIAAALVRLRGRRGHLPWMPPGPHDSQNHGTDDADGHRRRGHHRGGPGFGPGAGWGPWVGPMGSKEHRGDARISGPARMRVLEVLASSDHPLTVSELGEAIGVDQPRASRLVQQGVEFGLVRREADPDDARRTRIVLTEKGETFVRGFRDQRRDAITTALASFTDAERTDLARLLTKLADAWPS